MWVGSPAFEAEKDQIKAALREMKTLAVAGVKAERANDVEAVLTAGLAAATITSRLNRTQILWMLLEALGTLAEREIEVGS